VPCPGTGRATSCQQNVRIVNKNTSCTSNEHAVTWNVVGPTGPTATFTARVALRSSGVAPVATQIRVGGC
jgi:hypothetical protein